MRVVNFAKLIFNLPNNTSSLKDIKYIVDAIVKEISIDLINHKQFEIEGLGIIYCKTRLPRLEENPITKDSKNKATKLTKGSNIMFMNLSKEIRDFLKEAGEYGKTQD